jgi:multidrug efflux pump subunit AcrB
MNGLIRASLRNPIAVTVMVLTLVVLGSLAVTQIPVDILPVFRSPAVQTLVFYSGMPAASIEKNITARMERGVVQATGGRRLESRSIVGISIVRDYFRSNIGGCRPVGGIHAERRSDGRSCEGAAQARTPPLGS